MEAADACEIERLPEELLSAALSLTSPLDSCRAAAVSRAFRAAAESDAVWSRFLPRDLPTLAAGELSPAPPSKKGLFLRLAERPALLEGGLTSIWLDRKTGAKCYMLSARALNIAWGDTPIYWRWIPLPDCRPLICNSFSEAAELLSVCWLEIRGKINSKMLSRHSTYAAYLVFKLTPDWRGLDYCVQEASICIGESKSTHEVFFQIFGSEDEGEDEMHEPQLPRERGDGWMEVELGQFYNDEGEDGDVSISFAETKDLFTKSGLIVQGIGIRAVRS